MAKISVLAVTGEFHGYLDELLLLHQECLIERNWSLAQGSLQLLGELLRNHIEVEDRWIFPAHEQHCESPRWRTSLYSKEHEKLLSLLSNVERRLGGLIAEGGSRRGVIELIDYQRSFKNVMEHHEEREEIAMLPEVDNALGEEQLRSITDGISEQWSRALSLRADQIQHMKRALDWPVAD